MPLRDHFHGRDSAIWPWTSLHAVWITFIMEELNAKVLPPGYYALPFVHVGAQAHIDVATLQEGEPAAAIEEGNGGVATAVWAPPRATVVAEVDFVDPDIFEVRVQTEQEGQRLVAAIEVVSPANKDRPSHRTAFAAKCAAYLAAGVGLVIVDVVTQRRDSLHDELMTMLRLTDTPGIAVAADLYAVAYRTVSGEAAQRLEMWPAALAVGATLPLLPLWIAPDRAVPLDLEASYLVACRSLRMR